VREVIAVAESVTGCKIPILESDRRPGDPPVLVGTSQKARAHLGWQPRYADLSQIVGHAWQWHQKRHQSV